MAKRARGGFLRWQWQRWRSGVPPNPTPDSLPRGTPRIAYPRAAAGELRVTWIGQATVLVQAGTLNLLTDPVWSRRASPVRWAGPARFTPPGVPLDTLPPLDAVILSHDHYDHLDATTVRRLARLDPPPVHWLTPPGYATWLRRFDVRPVQLDWWDAAELDTPGGCLRAAPLPARHWCRRSPWDDGTRRWASWAFGPAGAPRLYFAGDSGYFSGFAEIGARLGPFIAALLPIGAYEPAWFMQPMHMNPEEAVQAYRDLGARGAFVAIHWGTFRLSDEPPLQPPERLRAAWRAAGLPPQDLWVLGHGETRVR